MRDVSGLIQRIGGQGHGVLEAADGTRAYVPYTLPGERVAARIKPAKHKTAHGDGEMAELIEIEAASPERIEPPCGHFHACGGCNLQHWQQESYAVWKRGRLVSALTRRDWSHEQAEAIVQPLLPIPPQTRRRAEFAARRVGKKLLLGFHEAESRRIVDLAECSVLRPELLKPLPRLREMLSLLIEDGRGLDIKLTLAENGIDALFTGPLKLDAGARQDLAMLAAELGIMRLCHRGGQDQQPEILAQTAAPRIKFGSIAVTLPPGGFLQATAEAEAAMAAALIGALPAPSGLRLADLFAGCGAFALRLAAAKHEVLACDADGPAINALTAAANAQQLAGQVRAERRDLERRPLLGAELKKLDAVLLDPPRAGARAQAAALAEAVKAKAAPPLVLMAACDPNSFARDARLLVEAGYRLETAQPIDQFLWTPHLELVAVFRRG
ncbi:class I SAM-dependent RNA methyltransferase [Ferrovibrio sp.]|uniref:class I SAM-dependent RNA methyltransferase n=1 Tax=Ferrovibrio sp. TaxID=1917215 RepID=UPI003D10145B